MGVNYQTACAYAGRWRDKYGLIEATGPKTGVFLNIEQLNDDEDYLPIIVNKCLGSDVVEIGKTSFEVHGWIEEGGDGPREFIIPATSKKQTLPTIYGAKILRRPEWWFLDVLSSSIQKNGMWLADPSMALADVIASRAYYDFNVSFFPKPDVAWVPSCEDLCGSEIRCEADLQNKINTVERRLHALFDKIGAWQRINVDVQSLLEEFRVSHLSTEVDGFFEAVP